MHTHAMDDMKEHAMRLFYCATARMLRNARADRHITHTDMTTTCAEVSFRR